MNAKALLTIAVVALFSALLEGCNLSPGLDLPTADLGNGGGAATGGSSANTGGAPTGGSAGSLEANALLSTGGTGEGGASSQEGGTAGAPPEENP